MANQFLTTPVLYREIPLNQHFSHFCPMVAGLPQLGHRPFFMRVFCVFLFFSVWRFLHISHALFSLFCNGFPQYAHKLFSARYFLIFLLLFFWSSLHLLQNSIPGITGITPQTIQVLFLILINCTLLYFVITNIPVIVQKTSRIEKTVKLSFLSLVGKQPIFKGLPHFAFSKYSSIARRICSAVFKPVFLANSSKSLICLSVRCVFIRFIQTLYTLHIVCQLKKERRIPLPPKGGSPLRENHHGEYMRGDRDGL